MAKLAIKKASTDVTVYLFIQDSSKTTGEGLTGLAYNTASLVASYVRPLGTRTAITLATLAAADSAHSDGGFKEVDATNMPGVYRLDLPDAVCATGVNSVVVMLKGAANMSPVLLELQLTDFDPNTAAITAAGIADAVWDEATADHTTASTFGALNANVDAILADTGTDGVIVASGTVTTLTNLPDAPTDWLTAAAVKADAVTKIQSGLALEATLTAIKGAGWTNETLAKIVVDISNIAAGSGATAQEVWEYATRVLTAGTNIDLSSLATASALTDIAGSVNTIDGSVETILNDLTNGGRLDLLIDAIKAKTDNLPADPADDSDIDTAIAAVKSVVDAIKTETDGHPTVEEIWSYGTRTLTTAVAGAVTPAEGDTLEITKDSTVIINFTGLGDITDYDDDTPGQEDKVWFTAKKNLDDPDTSAVIQIYTLYPAGVTPPDTLTYINGAAATATEGTFQFTDLVAGNATITLDAAAAADLPIYAVSPLYWDVKILKYSTGVVSILASGEMYIYGTPTISIS